MILFVFGLVTAANAQLSTRIGLGPNTCHHVVNGKFEYVSGNPACKEKRRSPSGDEVTYQVVVSDPFPVPPGHTPKFETRTLTQKLTKEGGKVVAISEFEGEDMKKAVSVMTTVLNPDATSRDNDMMQVRISQRADGKEDKYLTYDRNLCSRFRELNASSEELMLVKACGKVLPRYEDAAVEWNKKLKGENVKLGVPAIITDKGVTWRAANTGSVQDLISVASACLNFDMTYPSNEGGPRGEPNGPSQKRNDGRIPPNPKYGTEAVREL